MNAYYITVYSGNQAIAPIATRPTTLDRAQYIAQHALELHITGTRVTIEDMRTGRVVVERTRAK